MTSVREAIRAAVAKANGIEPWVPTDEAAFEAALEARGFAVVPIEPTQAMCQAMVGSVDEMGEARNGYRAALSARPRVAKEGDNG